MWILHNHIREPLVLELTDDKNIYHILPIFTDPDAAIGFNDNMEKECEAEKIDAIQRLTDIADILSEKNIGTVVLNPPDSDNVLDGHMVIYWSGSDFRDLLMELIDLSNGYSDSMMIDVIDQYILSVVRDGNET